MTGGLISSKYCVNTCTVFEVIAFLPHIEVPTALSCTWRCYSAMWRSKLGVAASVVHWLTDWWAPRHLSFLLSLSFVCFTAADSFQDISDTSRRSLLEGFCCFFSPFLSRIQNKSFCFVLFCLDFIGGWKSTCRHKGRGPLIPSYQWENSTVGLLNTSKERL